ncbi:MAG: hypothetical protein CMN28_12195 [Salinisphaeraceae bacterium]|jgi:hypothetical protein|nr:hypothetical protein [Salinisphaeraceae bacterium]
MGYLLRDIEIGGWYVGEDGQSFEVVAMDLSHQAIEIQYYDGTVEEIDFESWSQLEVAPTGCPSDQNGAFDLEHSLGNGLENIDISLGLDAMDSWSDTLQNLDRYQ